MRRSASKPLTARQRELCRALKNRRGRTDRELARLLEVKPAAVSRLKGRLLDRLDHTRCTAPFLHGERSHVIRPLSLSGLGGV